MSRAARELVTHTHQKVIVVCSIRGRPPPLPCPRSWFGRGPFLLRRSSPFEFLPAPSYQSSVPRVSMDAQIQGVVAFGLGVSASKIRDVLNV